VLELNKYTTTDHPFSQSEQNDGILLEEESNVEQMWTLLTECNPALMDPTTLGEMPPIETFARRTALMFEREIQLHAEYLAVVDRIKYIDEKRRKGDSVLEMNRRSLMLQSDVIFHDWDKTRACCSRMNEAYIIYRHDRMERVKQALSLYRDVHGGVDNDSMSSESWVPGRAFYDALLGHMNYLKMGLQMTTYYNVQNCVSEITGRPLFSPSEFTADLKLRLAKDPFHRSPIRGSVARRFQLVSIAY